MRPLNGCGKRCGLLEAWFQFWRLEKARKGSKSLHPLIPAVMSCVSSGFSCISGAISKGHIQVRKLFEAYSHHVSFSFLQVILGPMFSGKT